MLNWCWNYLTVSGTSEDMKKFYSKFTSQTRESFDFNDFAPMPKELLEVHTGACEIDGERCFSWLEIDGKNVPITEETKAEWMEKYKADNWYDWALSNWGTKWNCVNPDVLDVHDDIFYVKFDTAWSPPIQLLEAIAQMFPDLDIRNEWEEEGGYAGIEDYHDGYWTSHEGEVVHYTECCDERVTADWTCPECKKDAEDTYSEVIYK